MGTYLRVLSKSYLMNTNMTGFIRFLKFFASLMLWTNVASALEGLRVNVQPCLGSQGAILLTVNHYETFIHIGKAGYLFLAATRDVCKKRSLCA